MEEGASPHCAGLWVRVGRKKQTKEDTRLSMSLLVLLQIEIWFDILFLHASKQFGY